jgi:hypothetical protein
MVVFVRRLARRVTLALALLGLTRAAAQPYGAEISVNPGSADTDSNPAVAMEAAGRFVVVHQGRLPFAPDENDKIRVVKLDAQGALIGNNESLVLGKAPAVAVNPAGVGAIVWTDTDGGGNGVYGVRWSFSSGALGAPFRVNSYTTSSEANPDVAVDASGNFVVVWQSSTGVPQVRAQRFSSSGAPLGGEFRVSDSTSSQTYPSAAIDNSGAFVIVWGQTSGVGVRRYASSGAPLGDAFVVSSTFGGSHVSNADVAFDADGKFLVVWYNREPVDTNPPGYVVAQRFSNAGALLGGQFLLESRPNLSVVAPRTAGTKGGFAVAWAAAGIRQTFVRSSGEIGSLSTAVPITAEGNDPGVAANANGQLVTVFHRTTDEDVFAQRSTLPLEQVAGELRVNTVTLNSQQRPSVAEAADGSFLVVYQHVEPPATDILGQRYSSGGAPTGSAFRVSEFSVGGQYSPGVAALSGGRYVVAWTGSGAEGDGVYARRYDATGAPIGSDFRVATTTATPTGPVVSADTAGNFVVAWSGNGDSGIDVFARRYTSAGSPLAAAFRVNATTNGAQQYPAMAVSPNGDFVVAWQTSPFLVRDVYAQRYASSGAALGGEFRVNVSTNNTNALHPAVTANAQGDFVIAWDSDFGDASLKAILARRYSSAGAPLTGEFRVNTYTQGDQKTPALAYDASGALTVVWNSVAGQDGSNGGVFARRYTKTGEPYGDDFRVNTHTLNDQEFPSIAAGKNIVVAWASEIQDGSGDGVYAQVFRAPCRTSDANGDGEITVADVFYLINNLFAAGPAAACGGDANGDGMTTVTDVFHLINFLFAGGPAPA